MCVYVCVCVCAQSCLTLCDPTDCNPPGSSVHGIFQARVLEWGAIAFSKVALCCIKFIVRDSFQAHKYLMNLYHRDSRIVILVNFDGHFLI